MKNQTRSQIQLSVLLFCLCGVGVVSYVMASPPEGLIQDATLRLGVKENNLSTGIFDAGTGYAYLGTLSGQVVKVRADDLMRVGSLALGDRLVSAALDSAGGYGYFGSLNVSGSARLSKVRLADLTRVAYVGLNPDEDAVTAIALDVPAGYVYLGTHNATGGGVHVVKLRLSDLGRVGTLTLAPGGDAVEALVLHGGNVYVYTGGYAQFSKARIARVALATFTVDATLWFADDENASSVALLDESAGIGYFGVKRQMSNAPARVVKVTLATLTREATLDLDSEEVETLSGVLDAGRARLYIMSADHTRAGRVIEIDLATFTRLSTTVLNPEEESPSVAFLESAQGRLHLGTYTDPSRMVTLRLSDMTRVNSVAFLLESTLIAGVIDPAQGYAYFSTYPPPPPNNAAVGQIVKVRLSDFTRVDNLVFSESGQYFMTTAAAADTRMGYAYFGRVSGAPGLTKVRMADLSWAGEVQFGTGQEPTVVVVDSVGGYAYVGTKQSPARIIRVRLSDFSVDGSITLNEGENNLGAATLDATGGYAYFGTRTSPGQVVRVRLADFTRVDALTFNPGENTLTTAGLDSASGYAYFGTYTVPGRVVRVRLDSFARDGVLAFNSGEDYITAGAIDATTQVGFYSSDGSTRRVVQVDLATFTRAGSVALIGTTGTRSLVVDGPHGFLYVGTNDMPSQVYRVNYGADIALTGVVTPTAPNPGEAITYTLTVTNLGPNQAQSVLLTNNLPSAVAFDSATAPCTHLAGEVRCLLGTLTANQSVTIVIRGHVVGGLAPNNWLINRARVTGNEPDQHPESNRVELSVCSGACAAYNSLFVPLMVRNANAP